MKMRLALLVLTSLFLAAWPVGAAPWVFTRIDEIASSTLGSYNGLYPSLSQGAAVAWVKSLDGTSAPAYGLFRYENGTAVKLVDTAVSADYRDLGEPTISADGSHIAFAGKDDLDTVGVFPPVTPAEYHQNVNRWSASGLAVLDTSSPYPRAAGVFINEFPLTSGNGPRAADGGITAYVARTTEVDSTPFNSNKRRIYLEANGVKTLLVQDSTTRNGISPGFKLATADFVFGGMNQQGKVAFRSLHPNLTPTVTSSAMGIYLASVSGGIETVMETSVAYLPFTTFSNFVPYGVDNAGRVLLTSSFFYNPPGGPTKSSSSLFLKAPGSAPIQLAAGADFFISKGALSPAGRYVFRAQAFPPVGSAFTGLFTGPDLLADRIIKVGDALFGSTVTDLNIQSRSINDHGQVAFYYALSSGARGIAVATPAPELSWQMTGTGAAASLTFTWPQLPPTAPLDFKVWTSPDLSSWNPATGTTVEAGMHHLSVPMTASRGFFRLAP
jgi:hypothetical protein